MSEIAVQRIYEENSESGAKRILVDRLWPRGISKEQARLALWLKEVAPSTELRKAFHTSEIDWEVFQRRYLAEIKENPGPFEELQELARQGPITLLYASKSETENHALILKREIEAAHV